MRDIREVCVPLPSPHGGLVTSGPRKRGCRNPEKDSVFTSLEASSPGRQESSRRKQIIYKILSHPLGLWAELTAYHASSQTRGTLGFLGSGVRGRVLGGMESEEREGHLGAAEGGG